MPEEGGSTESSRKEEDKPNEEGGEEEEKSPFPTGRSSSTPQTLFRVGFSAELPERLRF